MKKSLALFISVLTLGISSCSSDNENEDSSGLTGVKWQYYQITASNFDSQEEVDQAELYDYESMYNECGDEGKHDYVQFNSNGTAIEAWYEGYNDGGNCSLSTYQGQWTKTGNIITVTANYGGNEYEIKYCEILEQTNNSMKIRERSVYHWDNNIDTSWRIYVFLKQ